jgi:putative transcriptional regulator
MFGLGKQRTRLGKFLDNNKIPQQTIERSTGLGESTLRRLCNDLNYSPIEVTKMKVVKLLRDQGFKVSVDDFW